MLLKRILPLIGLTLLLSGCVTGWLIGEWTDFSQEDFSVRIDGSYLGETITLKKDNTIYALAGTWSDSDQVFYGKATSLFGDRPKIAIGLKDDYMSVNVKYFIPSDSSTVLCTKSQRGLSEYTPYPINHGQAVTYPPPKGLIKVGMLVADLERLPWGTTSVVRLTYGVLPYVEVYHYRSDNPNLPELLVTVSNGRVTHVEGGAENEPGPSFTSDTASPSSTPNNEDRSWLGWLFDLVFR